MSSKMLMFALALSFSASVMAEEAVSSNSAAAVTEKVAAPKTKKHHKHKQAASTTEGAVAVVAPKVAAKHHHKKKATDAEKVAAPSTDAVTAGTTTDVGATTANTEIVKPAKKVKPNKVSKHHKKKDAEAATSQQL